MEKNEDAQSCCLSTKAWYTAYSDDISRSPPRIKKNDGPRMPTSPKPNLNGIVDRIQTLNLTTPDVSPYSKSVSSSCVKDDLSSPGFDEATLKSYGIEYLGGVDLTNLAKHPSFEDLPFIMFAADLPLEKHTWVADSKRLKKELANPAISKKYRVHWLDQNATFRLSNLDVGLQCSTNWEIEDYLGRDRSDLMYIILGELRLSSHSKDSPNRLALLNRLFFRNVGYNREMHDLGQSTIRCADLKPDFVASPFEYIDQMGLIASIHSLPMLEEIASFLSTLQKVPGTEIHPLPFLVGEFKKQGEEDRAEDGYQVFVEMAVIRTIHEAFFEKAPKYTFGIYQAHHEWQIYAMTTAHDPTKPWKKFEVAQVFKVDDSTCLGAIHKATAMLRLATYMLWQLQDLKIVSKDKQEELRAIYGDNSNGTSATCSKTSDPFTQSAQSNTAGGSQQNATISAANLAATHPLTEVRHLSDNIYLAKHFGEDCVIKVGERQKIKNEYRSYNRLQGSPYVAKMLAAYNIDSTFDCLVLKQYDQLPAAKSPEDVLLITEQLLTILSEMHALRLAHRDIKNSNIMWDEASRCIKLIDFETCIRVPSGAYFKPHCGTELFKAPEQLAEWWCSLKVDVFSAGLVCAAMMYGGRIRTEEGRDGVLYALETSYISPDSPAFVKPLLPLLKQMTAANLSERISANDALVLIKAIRASNPGLSAKSGQGRNLTVTSSVQATEGHPSKQFGEIKGNSFVPIHDDKENLYKANM